MDAIDLGALASTDAGPGPIWARQTDDLNVNVIAFTAGEGIGEHVNREVDVLIVAVSGTGTISVDGQTKSVSASQALIIPKGARRSIRAESDRFVYLSCHRRRAGLQPGDHRPADRARDL